MDEEFPDSDLVVAFSSGPKMDRRLIIVHERCSSLATENEVRQIFPGLIEKLIWAASRPIESQELDEIFSNCD